MEARGAPVEIVGRTGSLFTRVVLIMAEEAGIEYELQALDDLIAIDPLLYGGNPGLRIPVLRMQDDAVFGARNICRILSLRSARSLGIVWPEGLSDVISMNAQEIVFHSMTTQVQLLMMEDFGGHTKTTPFSAKARASLVNSLEWLDRRIDTVLSNLPTERDISIFEIELFCLVKHLQFGPTVAIEKHAALVGFAVDFGKRASAQRTVFY